MPLHGDDALFERVCLEAFQSGLSWITVLRKRPAFRPRSPGSRSTRSPSSPTPTSSG